ncbi:MAG: DUF6732 family protein [Pseudomonadota bacterium]
MSRFFSIFALACATFASSAVVALAHGGHLAPSGGHAHWEFLTGGAVVALIGTAVFIARDRRN